VFFVRHKERTTAHPTWLLAADEPPNGEEAADDQGHSNHNGCSTLHFFDFFHDLVLGFNFDLDLGNGLLATLHHSILGEDLASALFLLQEGEVLAPVPLLLLLAALGLVHRVVRLNLLVASDAHVNLRVASVALGIGELRDC